MLAVFDSKVTVRPEVAVASTVLDPSLKLASAGLVNVIVWLPLVMVRLCSSVAAFHSELTACVALIVQVPAVWNVRVSPEVPEVVQTAAVFDSKVTGRPEEALALRVIGPSSSRLLAGRPSKVIVWLPLAIVKLRSTPGAAFQLASPPCVALIVHVPLVWNVTVSPEVPETVQTLVVFDSNATARPEEAVASIVIGPWSRRFSAGALNVIVWLPLAIVKLCSTGVATFQLEFPDCVASIVHVP